ncbi:lysine exporter LysO family protein [Gallibacterium genomosp. 1]|uniref:Membrane protein n=1 Tax=Gallibacterium genomosp. 1 TaxID=155515 RepID=A0AB36DUW6_9PAST|nr:lysine exporter LysO family protein [Gallibacterium genomosp. 1]OBW98804.1 membrane protein [Gallibacterium genomosp. 1]OBW99975.1 membrane protein [Gallibacterium genomosp. 1]
MLESLSIVLVPLFLGYLIKSHNVTFIHWVNKSIMWLLFLILFVMGCSLGQLDDLARTLPNIAFKAAVFSLVIHGLNILCLMLYDKRYPVSTLNSQKQMPSRLKMILDSAKMCSMVVLGFIIGFLGKNYFSIPHGSSTYVLIVLIFLVGIQLRNSGINLRQVFFNKHGIAVSILLTISSLCGGILAALTLQLSIVQGLAIASGMGWYSLSSVLLNDAWGPIWGSIAFFNDLSREIASLFLIPLFMHHFRATAIGIAGATALDCTLPIIQRSGGIEAVPLAISFGFIINLVVPVLLVFFINIPL